MRPDRLSYRPVTANDGPPARRTWHGKAAPTTPAAMTISSQPCPSDATLVASEHSPSGSLVLHPGPPVTSAEQHLDARRNHRFVDATVPSTHDHPMRHP